MSTINGLLSTKSQVYEYEVWEPTPPLALGSNSCNSDPFRPNSGRGSSPSTPNRNSPPRASERCLSSRQTLKPTPPLPLNFIAAAEKRERAVSPRLVGGREESTSVFLPVLPVPAAHGSAAALPLHRLLCRDNN